MVVFWKVFMEKMNIVFYSKNNDVLGKRIKNVVNKIGFELTYSNELAMVTDIVVEGNRSIVFVDKVFSKYAKMVSHIISSKIFNNVLVVFVDDDEEKYKEYTKSVHLNVITERNLENEVLRVLQSCRQFIDSKVNVDMRVVSDVLSGYLSKLGFSPKHSGYRYIKQCVEYAIQNSFDIGKSLYKETYLFVGKKNNESIAGVERNIRNAISQAYLNTGFDVETFESLHENKVTNRMFLSYLVDRISVDENIYITNEAI